MRAIDPISPYLFLLASEGLSSLLKDRCTQSELIGLKVAPSAPRVSHLLFADDSIFFLKASAQAAVEIRDVMNFYCNASGQRINLDKSVVFFSKGCPNELKDEVKQVLQVQSEALSEKYLGMPTEVGKLKNGVFKYLKDRLWKRIQRWIEQLLFAAAKEVLIKSVAQALPTYAMGCFKLPRGLCEHIDSSIRKFWWGAKEGKRKTAWVSWKDMCQPKYLGGMGFRQMEIFNLAFAC